MPIIVHPEFVAHGSFAHLKLGRNKPADPPRLKLAKYLDDSVVIPATPSAVDYVSAVPSWPMYGNDQLGDCEAATTGHMVQAWTANAGGLVTPPEKSIEQLYWETGDPPSSTGTAGGPTDTGRDDVTVLSYLQHNGLPGFGHPILAYAAVDPTNLDHVKAALWLFGGIRLAVMLPLSAQGQPAWDIVPDAGESGEPGSWGGHSIPGEAFVTNSGITVITWGAPLRMTYRFLEKYAAPEVGGAAYAVISPDWFEKASEMSPDGFDSAQLQADLADLAAAS